MIAFSALLAFGGQAPNGKGLNVPDWIAPLVIVLILFFWWRKGRK
ncbi:MAG TPA: hypothetical protein VKJ65_00915 [Phycisphaerae bacterium]|nr:hypothetical protein [Phycisphaerae bacterium]